jgi:hypothetical protein
MAEKDVTSKTTPAAKPSAVAVRLSGDSPAAQPVFSNYSAAVTTSGLVLIDFGFLEPAMLAALSRAARAGGKIPGEVNGRLAARVALAPETARALHAQLGRLLSRPAEKAKLN